MKRCARLALIFTSVPTLRRGYKMNGSAKDCQREASKRMQLLLTLLLLVLWSAVGRSDPICVPGSIRDRGDIETYDPDVPGSGVTLIVNCTQTTGPIIQIRVEPSDRPTISWSNTTGESVSIGYTCAGNVSYNYTTTLPRGFGGRWTSGVLHTDHDLALGDECTFFGCYWYVYRSEWIIEDGTPTKPPDQVDVMSLMPFSCIIDDNECDDGTAQCDHICTDIIGGYNCSCRNGYLLEPDGHNCTDIDECATGLHNCEHFCANNTAGSFNCSCFEGYALNDDMHTCDDVDECELNETLCYHNCINTNGSYECECQDGYEFSSDGYTCEDIDECSLTETLCDHYCSNTNGSYVCGCMEGYELSTDGHTCKDINECARGLALCQHNCTNGGGNYTCSCKMGYELVGEYNCTALPCTLVECEAHSTCRNVEGGHICECHAGYERKGYSCELKGISHLKWVLPVLLLSVVFLLMFCAYMLWKKHQRDKYNLQKRYKSFFEYQLKGEEVDFGYDPLTLSHSRKVSYTLSIISPLDSYEQQSYSVVPAPETEFSPEVSESRSSEDRKHTQLTETVDASTAEGQEGTEEESQSSKSTKGDLPQPVQVPGSESTTGDDGKSEIFQLSGYVSHTSTNDRKARESFDFAMEEFDDLDEGEDPLSLMETAFSESLTYEAEGTKPIVNAGYVQGIKGKESGPGMPQPDSPLSAPHSSPGGYITEATSFPTELGPLVEEPEIADILRDDAPTPTPCSAGYVSESQLPSDAPSTSAEDCLSPDGYLHEVPLSKPLPNASLFTSTLETQSHLPITSHCSTDLSTGTSNYIPSGSSTSSGYTSEAAMPIYQVSSHMPSTSPTCPSDYVPSNTSASSGYASETIMPTYQLSSPEPNTSHCTSASSGNYISSTTSASSGYVSESAVSPYQPNSPVTTTSYQSSSGSYISSNSSASSGYVSEAAMPTYQLGSPVPTTSHYSSTSSDNCISSNTLTSSGYVSETATFAYQPSSPVCSAPSTSSCNYISSNSSASSGYVSEPATSTYQPSPMTSSVELNTSQMPCYSRDSPSEACWYMKSDPATYVSSTEALQIPSDQQEAASMGQDASLSVHPSKANHQPQSVETESTSMGHDKTPIEDHLLQEGNFPMLSEMPIFIEHSETLLPQRWGFDDAGYIDGGQLSPQPTMQPTVDSSKQLTADSGEAISFQLDLDNLEQCDNGLCTPSTPASAGMPLAPGVTSPPIHGGGVQYTMSHSGYVQSH